MTRSMTAFARQEATESWGVITLELRSVNHRYLDISFRLPEELRALEGKLREQIQKRLSRGKVDCQIRYQPAQQTSEEIKLDLGLVAQLANATEQVKTCFPEQRSVSALEVIRWPGVMQMPEVDAEVLHVATMKLLDVALSEMVDSREREGQKLNEVIAQRCEGVAKIVVQMRELIPEIKQGWRERLVARLEEIKASIDETRLEQEMAFMAQKIDVEEELDRLETHIEEVRRVLKQTKPVGRRLDFLMQELNREANTLGSKSIDARTGSASVDLKVLIEQMREQVQNIE